MQGIYAITNILTDTVYYGQAVNIEQRFRQHKYLLNHNKHYNLHLQNSFNKYGLSAFVFAPVQLIENKEDLVEKEQEYIDNAYFLGLKNFNKADATGSRLGYKASESTIKKMSKANLGKKHSEKTKQKMRNNHSHYWLGKERNKETREKIKKSNLGKIHKKRNQKYPIEKIKELNKKGFSQANLAVEYKCNQSTISRIIKGRKNA